LDGTNSYLNETVNYCEENVTSTYTTEEYFTHSEISTTISNRIGRKRHGAYSSRFRNNTFEESLRLTKCCTERYFQFLENKMQNSTSLDKVLDVFLGTVEFILKLDLFLIAFLLNILTIFLLGKLGK
jgi:hypothetical protein